MKKLLLLVLCLSLLSPAYGASEDVYVRQDVFDAKMEAFMAEIRLGNERLQGELQVINTKLEALDKRITDSEAHTSARIDDLKTIVYWGLSGLALMIGFAIFGPSFGEFLRNLRKPSITLDDVKRLIAEAKLSTPQI